MKMKMNQVKEILGILNARTVGNKRELQKRLINICDPSNLDREANDRLFNELSSVKFSETALRHDLYRKNFNAEDLANRMWYKTEGSEAVRFWTTKFMWGLIRQSLINAFVVYKDSGATTSYADWRRAACEKILGELPVKKRTNRGREGGTKVGRGRGRPRGSRMIGGKSSAGGSRSCSWCDDECDGIDVIECNECEKVWHYYCYQEEELDETIEDGWLCSNCS